MRQLSRIQLVYYTSSPFVAGALVIGAVRTLTALFRHGNIRAMGGGSAKEKGALFVDWKLGLPVTCYHCY